MRSSSASFGRNANSVAQPATLHAHHVRKLADLTRGGQPAPLWVQRMVDAATQVAHGLPTLPRRYSLRALRWTSPLEATSLESAVTRKRSCGVRRRAVGKGQQCTSLAAYPTACSVRRGADGKGSHHAGHSPAAYPTTLPLKGAGKLDSWFITSTPSYVRAFRLTCAI